MYVKQTYFLQILLNAFKDWNNIMYLLVLKRVFCMDYIVLVYINTLEKLLPFSLAFNTESPALADSKYTRLRLPLIKQLQN